MEREHTGIKGLDDTRKHRPATHPKPHTGVTGMAGGRGTDMQINGREDTSRSGLEYGLRWMAQFRMESSTGSILGKMVMMKIQ